MKLAAIGLALTLASVPLTLQGCWLGDKAKLVEQDIVNACVVACSFVPEIETVTNFLVVLPGISTVDQAVNLLCDGFRKWQAANPPAPAKVGDALSNAPAKVTFTMDIGGKPFVASGLVLKK